MYPFLGTFIFPVYTYGVLLSFGFLTAILLAIHHAPLLKLAVSDVVDLALWFMISAMLGARLLFILLFPQQFPTILSWFEFNKGGLVFFGGFIATALTVILFSRQRGIRLRDLGDLIAPSLATGQFLGRLGCFANGCCYGRKTESVFGLVFPNLAEQAARHPTQLYEAGFMLFLLVSLSWALRNRAGFSWMFPGAIWGTYALGYGAFRFSIEFIRDDERGGFFTPLQLSISQVVALLVMIAGIIWLIACRQRHLQEKQALKDFTQGNSPPPVSEGN